MESKTSNGSDYWLNGNKYLMFDTFYESVFHSRCCRCFCFTGKKFFYSWHRHSNSGISEKFRFYSLRWTFCDWKFLFVTSFSAIPTNTFCCNGAMNNVVCPFCQCRIRSLCILHLSLLVIDKDQFFRRINPKCIWYSGARVRQKQLYGLQGYL